MTYGAYVSDAARYAALALTAPPPGAAELPAVLLLRDDVAGALSELMPALADRAKPRTPARFVARMAGDPVGALLARVARLPTLGAGWDQRPPPSRRWAARPIDPSTAVTTVQVWKGLAVATVLAADSAQRGASRPDGATRWTALGDAAALAEALTALDPPLVTASGLTPARAAAALEAAAALGVEAREVAALAAGVRADGYADAAPSTGGRPRVVIVSGLPALPAAAANLARLLAGGDTRLGVAGVNAAAIALARVSLAAAAALDSAATAPSAATPDLLRAAAAAMREHGTRLQHALMAHSAGLATLEAGPPGLHHQATEIVTGAESRIRDLVPRPAEALTASPDLLEYATRCGDATAAIARALTNLDRSGDLLKRDRSERAPRAGWVPTNRSGAAAPLHTELGQAVDAARAAPMAPRAWFPAPAVTPSGPVVDLRGAVARRRTALRPTRPAVPLRDATSTPAVGPPGR